MDAIDDKAETELQPGMYLDSYRLRAKLGQGGYATVYLAEASHRGQTYRRQVALKVLHTGHEVEKFRREAFITAHLRHGPHILQFEGQNINNPHPYIILEYAPYGSLAQFYTHSYALPPMLVALYVQQIASALQYMHDEGFVHCDVKPDNMMLRSRHEIVLADFGITHRVHTPTTQLEGIGTISYMAPEQLLGYPEAASDQYALAVTAYQLLTGTLPFQGSKEQVQHAHVSKQAPSILHSHPELPQSLDSVLQRALFKQPQRRYRTVEDFAQAFVLACTPTNRTRQPLQRPSDQHMRTRGRTADTTSYNGHRIYLNSNGERHQSSVPYTTRRVPHTTRRINTLEIAKSSMPLRTTRNSIQRRASRVRVSSKALIVPAIGGIALVLFLLLGINLPKEWLGICLYITSAPYFWHVLGRHNILQSLLCLLCLLAEAVALALNAPFIFCLLYEILTACCVLYLMKTKP